MNIGSYQQQQHYPQFNVDPSHSVNPAPSSDNKFTNVPRAVSSDVAAKVPSEMHNLTNQIADMSVRDPQHQNMQYAPPNMGAANNSIHYENSVQYDRQTYPDQMQGMAHPPATQNMPPNTVGSYSNSKNVLPPNQFPMDSKNRLQNWPPNHAFNTPSMPPQAMSGQPSLNNQVPAGLQNRGPVGPPSNNNHAPTNLPPMNNHASTNMPPMNNHASTNMPPMNNHASTNMPPMNSHFSGPPAMNNHAASLPQTAPPPVGMPPNQMKNMHPNATLPPNYQYNQKPVVNPPSQQYMMNRYDPSRPTNGIPNNQAMMGGMPPPIRQSRPDPYGPAYGQPEFQSHQSTQPVGRLDPDFIPNPIQVMIDNQEERGNETFITNQVGAIPPLVTTFYRVEDEGNANPRFIRSTMYSVPCTADIMKQADVPFSLIITPLATLPSDEQEPPLVDTGNFGPVRCVRCKAYMNPYMKFIDGGRRFSCVLCSAPTDVPAEYFQHLDHTGARVDRYERPELVFGSYEFTVTKDYCKDNELPNVPAFIFIIDVSYNNVKSGMVKLFCEQITDIILNYMPNSDNGHANSEDRRMRVGFITYDSSVHFYNIKACLGQPQMMIVGDVEDMFVPLLDGFLCDPVESSTVIHLLMQQIPNRFCDTKETDILLLPAVKAGLEALKAAKCAGKLFVFHSSLPTCNAPGKLGNREDRKLLGSDKEKTVLTSQNLAYTNLAQECVNAGCSIDLYILNNAHVDLATIGQLSKITGGEIFKYTYFQAEIDGERLMEDVKRNLSRQIVFDAVMRVRTSTGIRPLAFYGNFNMTTATDIELASINADKSIAVEIKHDDKLSEEEGAFIQVALLYTSCSGQRKVRIFNLALKCCSQMSELFRHCELDTLINYWSKAAVSRLLEATPRQVKESIVNRSARILACYRKVVANPSSPGQLILPETMKLLPLYASCLIKSDAISGGSDMTVDDRCFMMHAVSIMDIPSSLNYFYPRVLPLVNVDSQMMPTPIRCTNYKLTNREAYILENGVYIFLWIGTLVPQEWLVNVFGVADFSLININLFKLPVFENIHSRSVNSILEQIQRERRRTMKLTIVREHDKLEIVFKRFLVEDSTNGAFNPENLSSASYVDFLCYVHKEIRNLLA